MKRLALALVPLALAACGQASHASTATRSLATPMVHVTKDLPEEVSVAPSVAPSVSTPVHANPVASVTFSRPTATVVHAGADGAFAYCDRGMNAYNPCSEAYYAPGTAITVGKVVTLADGLRYWTVTLTGPEGAPVPPCGACTASPAKSFTAFVPVSEVR